MRLLLVLIQILALTGALQARDVLPEVLEAANLSERDLSFPLLPEGRDSLRLQVVEDVLKEGLRLDEWSRQLAQDLEEMHHLDALVRRLALCCKRVGEGDTGLEAAAMPAGGARVWKKWRRDFHRLADSRFLAEKEVQAIERDLKELLQEDPERDERSVFELDSLERLGRQEALSRKVRLENLRLPETAELREALRAIDRLFLDIPFLKAAVATLRPFEDERYGRMLYADEKLLIGDTGRNRYLGELPPIVIDMGGSDEYGPDAAVSRGDLSLLLDLSGNDVYRGSAESGPASTVGGLSVLLDLAGDDLYEGQFHCQAAALAGVALLIDQQGDDRYFSQLFSQGAGSMGIAALVDGDGQDLYSSSLYAQGFGHLAGFGLLQDMSGHDQYLLRPRFLDQIRYEDHHLTLGQGFGFGQRPDLSGGIGLLHDLNGNDSYSADIYGQGSAYWWALGFLIDRAGNDRYAAWQYAQGAGVHLAAGALLDDSGMDVYHSRGVSQGCGHDLALGLLHDRAGDDNYLAWDLSQGGGNANGTGILLDESGDDAYMMRGMRKHRAFGDTRRRTGSIGLFADLDGEDHYAGRGGDNEIWAESLRGFGLDRDTELLLDVMDSSVYPEEDKGLDPLFDPAAKAGHLYIWAIRLEPRWTKEREKARESLLERPQELLDLIRDRELLASRISWERHALKDLLRGLTDQAMPLYDDAMHGVLHPERNADKEDLRRARGMSLWVLGLMPELAEAELFRDWLELPGVGDVEALRAQLLENLALRGAGEAVLLSSVSDTSVKVRRSAAWGLGRLQTGDGRRALMRSLADPALVVREAAARGLEKDTLLAADMLLAELQALDSESMYGRELLNLLIRSHPGEARSWLDRLPADAWWNERQLLAGKP